jgi:hypothetical protein
MATKIELSLVAAVAADPCHGWVAIHQAALVVVVPISDDTRLLELHTPGGAPVYGAVNGDPKNPSFHKRAWLIKCGKWDLSIHAPGFMPSCTG